MGDGPDRRRVSTRTRVRGLESRELCDLLVALWERQGYDVSVAARGGSVLVTRARETTSETLEVHPVRPDGDSLTSEDLEATLAADDGLADADGTVVVTPATDERDTTAEGRPSTRMVDGDDLVALIADLEAADLLEEYAPTRGPTSAETHGLHARPTFLLVALATAAWFFTLLLLSVFPALYPSFSLPLTVAGAIGVVALWLVVPATTFLDATRLHDLEVEHRPPRLRWVTLALFGAGFASSYYLYRRLEHGQVV